MKDKNFAIRVASIIFGIVAVLHLARIIFDTSVVIGGWTVPVWISWLGFFGASFLAGWVWSVAEGKKEG